MGLLLPCVVSPGIKCGSGVVPSVYWWLKWGERAGNPLALAASRWAVRDMREPCHFLGRPETEMA